MLPFDISSTSSNEDETRVMTVLRPEVGPGLAGGVVSVTGCGVLAGSCALGAKGCASVSGVSGPAPSLFDTSPVQAETSEKVARRLIVLNKTVILVVIVYAGPVIVLCVFMFFRQVDCNHSWPNNKLI